MHLLVPARPGPARHPPLLPGQGPGFWDHLALQGLGQGQESSVSPLPLASARGSRGHGLAQDLRQPPCLCPAPPALPPRLGAGSIDTDLWGKWLCIFLDSCVSSKEATVGRPAFGH